MVDTKNALLETSLLSNSTDEGKASHSFLLMTSLNSDPSKMWSGAKRLAGRSNGTAQQALKFLLEDSFHKVDDLVQQQNDEILDPGMLAVYNLILANEATQFATCARDGVLGCNAETRRICESCNHIGKFGKLEFSLRKSSFKNKDTSWGCWPQSDRERTKLKQKKKAAPKN